MTTYKQTRNVEQHISHFSDIFQEFHETLTTLGSYDETPILPFIIAIEPIVPLLPHLQMYADPAIKQCKNPPDDGLSVDESAAIRFFSMEAQFNDKPPYAVLNDALRSKNIEKIRPWLYYVKLLCTALSRLPSTNGTVFRGVKLDFSQECRRYGIIVWSSFSSCTTIIDVLGSENFYGRHGDRTMFVINCITGKNIQNHSCYPDESEILLLPGTRFKVIGCLNQGSGLSTIQLQELAVSSSPSEPWFVRVSNESFTDIDIETEADVIEIVTNDKNKENIKTIENEITEYGTDPVSTCSEPIVEAHIDDSNTVALTDSIELEPSIGSEVFEQYIGDVKIIENGYVVVHGREINSGEARGKLQYTAGKHRLRFKVEKLSTCIFIGIISNITPLEQNSYQSSSSYGWISEDHYFKGGTVWHKGHICSVYDILADDTIELVIDVTTQTLHYRNERKNQSRKLTVDLQKCPLPWQILVNLSDRDDQLRLLSYTVSV